MLQLAGASGYPSAVLPSVRDQFTKINSILNLGVLTPTSDPNLSTLNFSVAANGSALEGYFFLKGKRGYMVITGCSSMEG